MEHDGRLKTVTTTEAQEAERSGAERAGAGETFWRPELFVMADQELREKALRRQISAKYKMRVLEEADACSEPGKIGALLR